MCHSVVRLEMLEDPFVSKTGLQWALSYAATDRNAGSSKKVSHFDRNLVVSDADVCVGTCHYNHDFTSMPPNGLSA